MSAVNSLQHLNGHVGPLQVEVDESLFRDGADRGHSKLSLSAQLASSAWLRRPLPGHGNLVESWFLGLARWGKARRDPSAGMVLEDPRAQMRRAIERFGEAEPRSQVIWYRFKTVDGPPRSGAARSTTLQSVSFQSASTRHT